MRKFAALGLLVVLIIAFQSCATAGMSSVEKVEFERQNRAYDRYVDDHIAKNKKALVKPGIHYYKKAFYVVISLTDSGVDSYPEWAGEKLVSNFLSYKIIDKDDFTMEDYANYILEFEVVEEIDTGYTNIVQVKVPEKATRVFRKDLR